MEEAEPQRPEPGRRSTRGPQRRTRTSFPARKLDTSQQNLIKSDSKAETVEQRAPMLTIGAPRTCAPLRRRRKVKGKKENAASPLLAAVARSRIRDSHRLVTATTAHRTHKSARAWAGICLAGPPGPAKFEQIPLRNSLSNSVTAGRSTDIRIECSAV